MALLQNFYETTLEALREAKNDRLWFKTNTKLGKLYFDREDYGKLQRILKQLHQSCQVSFHLQFCNQVREGVAGKVGNCRWDHDLFICWKSNSLSGNSKCSDQGKKIKIEPGPKMQHLFIHPSELFLVSTCYKVLWTCGHKI